MFERDSLEDDFKNDQMIKMKDQIEDLIKNGNGDEVVDDRLEQISLGEVYDYLEGEYLDIESPRVNFYQMERSREDFNMLCDYCDINLGESYIPLKTPQRVYFLESKDYALTFIPIQLIDGSVSYRIEALENMPDFITEMYANLEDEKLSKKKNTLEKGRVIFDKYGNRI